MKTTQFLFTVLCFAGIFVAAWLFSWANWELLRYFHP